MAKQDPAVLWYWNDWLGGTFTMSRFLKGCYMDLLAAQHNSGHLSLDEIKTVLGSDFGSSWPTLQKKFVKDDNGLFYNARAKQERESRRVFTDSRRTNLQKKTNHMGDHMENENENRNESKNENGIMGEIAVRVLAHLISLSGRNYLTTNQLYLRRIIQRLKEGYTEEELMHIVEYKVCEWKGTEFEKYLQPDTLFNKEKCNKYRDQVTNAKEKGHTSKDIRGKQSGNDNLVAEAMAAAQRSRL